MIKLTDIREPNYVKKMYNIEWSDICIRLGIDYDTLKHQTPNMSGTTMPNGNQGISIEIEEYFNGD